MLNAEQLVWLTVELTLTVTVDAAGVEDGFSAYYLHKPAKPGYVLALFIVPAPEAKWPLTRSQALHDYGT